MQSFRKSQSVGRMSIVLPMNRNGFFQAVRVANRLKLNHLHILIIAINRISVGSVILERHGMRNIMQWSQVIGGCEKNSLRREADRHNSRRTYILNMMSKSFLKNRRAPPAATSDATMLLTHFRWLVVEFFYLQILWRTAW